MEDLWGIYSKHNSSLTTGTKLLTSKDRIIWIVPGAKSGQIIHRQRQEPHRRSGR